MINRAELQRRASREGIPLEILERDYVLGWVLWGLFSDRELQKKLVFKGGTCLKKVYFSDFRFSVDLDFTLPKPLSPSSLLEHLQDGMLSAEAASGLSLTAAPLRIETIDDTYGQKTYRVRLYYRGPVRERGSPAAIVLDLNRSEQIVFPVQTRPLLHDYSDSEVFGTVQATVYILEEILAEKLRALYAQRAYAISKDLFDLHWLLAHGVDVSRALEALPAKCGIKGIPMDFKLKDHEEYERDWEQNLRPLLPQGLEADFERAWQEATALLPQLQALREQ